MDLLERFAATPDVLDAAVLAVRHYIEWQSRGSVGGGQPDAAQADVLGDVRLGLSGGG